jgi:hypothetical protein
MALTQTPELLIEVTPVGLAVQGFAALPPGVAFCELSSQGTRWLLVQDGGAGVPGQLLALEPASLAVGLVAMLPAEPQNGLIALRSDSLGRAWCLSGLSNLTPLPTDPFGPADPLISLPAAYTAPLRMIGE